MIGAEAAFANAHPEISLEGQPIAFDQPLLNVDGWIYVPVREFADHMGWTLAYDKQSAHISIENALGDKLEFQPGASEVVYNAQRYRTAESVRIVNDYTYLPLRMIAEAMHAKVGWSPEEKAVNVVSVPVHVVAGGDTWATLAEAYQTSAEALRIRNGLTEETKGTLQVGQTLKVVIPAFMVEQPEAANDTVAEAAVAIDPDEMELLAKLVQVEAGGESYEGKLAVASVVMNRVNSPKFPDTLYDVIHAPNQFPPAKNGKLAKAVPSEDSIKAARAALSGENNVPGAVYFFNGKLEPNKRNKLTVVKEIGNHVFAK